MSVARCEGGIATRNCIANETLKEAVFEEIEERFIKNFLDIITLKIVKDAVSGGYDILSRIQRKFGVLLSAGSVYAMLYSLERKGLVKASLNQRARRYMLTEKGEETLKVITTMKNQMEVLAGNVF